VKTKCSNIFLKYAYISIIASNYWFSLFLAKYNNDEANVDISIGNSQFYSGVMHYLLNINCIFRVS